MHLMRRWTGILMLAATCVPMTTAAQARPDSSDWKFQVAFYAYLPSISGTTVFPTGVAGPSFNIDASTLLSHLEGAFMGHATAHYKRAGALVDWIYSSVSGSGQSTRELSVAGIPVGSVQANLGLDVKLSLLTLGGTWTAVKSPAVDLDLLAGARQLDLQQTLSWTIIGNLPAGVNVSRSGQSRVPLNNWDGVGGVIGQWRFERGRRWFIPFGADAGAGASKFTWQGMLGIGYSFKALDVAAAWRYIDYEFSSGFVNDFSLSGPLIGLRFNF